MLIQFIVISKNMQFSLQMTVTVADDLKNNEGKNNQANYNSNVDLYYELGMAKK